MPADTKRTLITLAAPLAAALALAAPASAPAAACPGAAGRPAALSPAAAASATLCLLNAERRAHGLAPLRANIRLSRAAGGHALDMDRRGYFSHYSPGGRGT